MICQKFQHKFCFKAAVIPRFWSRETIANYSPRSNPAKGLLWNGLYTFQGLFLKGKNKESKRRGMCKDN